MKAFKQNERKKHSEKERKRGRESYQLAETEERKDSKHSFPSLVFPIPSQMPIRKGSETRKKKRPKGPKRLRQRQRTFQSAHLLPRTASLTYSCIHPSTHLFSCLCLYTQLLLARLL
mmetsp:Transcript_30065/g.59019  ORF Transcript_30065/g.59019 Transcript_30065/m.59019 type:complete len:117 (+) Transcript_30065:2612-2962(+)